MLKMVLKWASLNFFTFSTPINSVPKPTHQPHRGHKLHSAYDDAADGGRLGSIVVSSRQRAGTLGTLGSEQEPYKTVRMLSKHVIWESCYLNFRGLVLGCINTDFYDKIRFEKLSLRSTRCTLFYRSQSSIFQHKKSEKFHLKKLIFQKICKVRF